MNDFEKRELYFGNLPFKMFRLKNYFEEGRRLRFFAGENIRSQMDDGFIFYIDSGSFKINVRREDQSDTDFAYCRKDSILQVNPLLTGNLFWDPADCTAMENSEVVMFTRQKFYEFISRDQQLFDEYVDNASTYSSMLKQRLLITAGLSGSQRLLNWLDKLCRCSTPDADGIYRISSNMTQQQIADFLFIHVTTCNKIFSKLNREHIVKYSRGEITVYDEREIQNYLEQNWRLLR